MKQKKLVVLVHKASTREVSRLPGERSSFYLVASSKLTINNFNGERVAIFDSVFLF